MRTGWPKQRHYCNSSCKLVVEDAYAVASEPEAGAEELVQRLVKMQSDFLELGFLLLQADVAMSILATHLSSEGG